MSMTDKINEKLSADNQSQDTKSENPTNETVETNPTNTDGKFKLKLIIDGKEEIREYTAEELANKVQLADVSTQRFQEAAELRQKVTEEGKRIEQLLKKLSNNAEQQTQEVIPESKKNIKEDYDDDILVTVKKLETEIERLRNEQITAFKTVKEQERETKLNSIINKYNVDRNFIEKEVLPYMSTKAVDDIETAIKAVLFEKGRTKMSSITKDGNGVNIENPKSVEESILDSIFSQSNLGMAAKLNRK